MAVSLLLLLTLAVTLAFSSLLHLIGMTISPITAVLAVVISINLFLYIEKERDTKENIRSVLFAFVIVGISVFLSSRIFDLSYDGNWYHKASLGSLASGWNPIYETFESFAANPDGVRIGNLEESAIWANHYCKGPWIIGANIYSLTGNIECAKAINLIMIFVTFSIALDFLKKRLHTVPATVLALLTALNPISVPQMFTFYNDGLLCSVLFSVIILLLKLRLCDGDRKINAACLFSAIVICCNIKFTGLAYAAVFCFAFYIFGLVDSVKRKTFRKSFTEMTAFYASAVAASVLFVGSSSYIKNFIEHKNPLYPLIGKDSVDIMTMNQPRFFDGLSTVKKLFYSLFSRVDNLMGEGAVIPKPPFDVSPYEARISASAPDLRISGFGPLFGGILILSAMILLFALFYFALTDRRVLSLGLCVVLPTAILLLAVSESWWARYSPHLYLLPLTALYFLVFLFGKAGRYARPAVALCAVGMSLLLMANCSFFALYVGKCALKSEEIRDRLVYARVLSEKTPIEVAFATYAYYGIEFNLKDSKINYRVVAELPEAARELYADKARMYLPESEAVQ